MCIVEIGIGFYWIFLCGLGVNDFCRAGWFSFFVAAFLLLTAAPSIILVYFWEASGISFCD